MTRSALAIAAMATGCAGAKPVPPEKINGLRVIDVGSGGVPVVFLPGLCGSAEVWRGQIDHLRGSRRVLAYDQRGHGSSDRAQKYTLDLLAGDLETLVGLLHLDKFWLVGHSMSGTVLTTYAARHGEQLVGLIYVDAVGDLRGASPELKKWFRDAPPDLGVPQMKSMFGEMLGPKAKPQTREKVLADLDECDPRAFVELRQALVDAPLAEMAARYSGAKFAIEAEGEAPFAASRLPGVQRRTLAEVSHWLMLDDQAAFNSALDEILK
jgi:pimeloyl-ACP methyl ester carboxylesterase